MALIKNEIPILEYDTEESAVLMPGHSSDHHFTEKAVLLFMEQEQIDDYIAVHDCEVTGTFESIVKQFSVYETEIDKQRISFVQMPLGGAGAVQIMEQMIGGGSKKFIAGGWGHRKDTDQTEASLPQMQDVDNRWILQGN